MPRKLDQFGTLDRISLNVVHTLVLGAERGRLDTREAASANLQGKEETNQPARRNWENKRISKLNLRNKVIDVRIR